jgi:hypothetical protein
MDQKYKDAQEQKQQAAEDNAGKVVEMERRIKELEKEKWRRERSATNELYE